MRLPLPGFAVALGLTVAECGLVLRNLLRGFGNGGVLDRVLPYLAVYLLLGGLCDLMIQAFAPLKLRSHRGLRGGAALALAFALGVASGQLLFSLSLVLLAAGLFAWALFRPRLRWLALSLALAGGWRVVPTVSLPELQPEGPAPAGPNVAVIVLDTLRKDRLSTYGYTRETSPNLTALAARGVRFDQAWTTAPWSLPAHGSLFTGELPSTHGAHNQHPRMEENRTLLAERMLAAGYQTAGFSANPFAGSGVGMAQGYGHFEDHWRLFTLHEVLLGARVVHGLLGSDRDKSGADIIHSLRRWWTEDRDPQRPAYVFVNLMEAHGPYQEVPLPERVAYTEAGLIPVERAAEAVHMAQLFYVGVEPEAQALGQDVLDGAVLATDRYLGELLDILGEDTLLVVLSDHGEVMGEHAYWGHNTGLWSEIVDVPLVMAGPGLPEGQVFSDPVSTADVMPTLMGLLAQPVPEVYGQDLGPALRGEERLAGRVVYAEHAETVYTLSGWRTRNPFMDLSAHLSARRASTDGHSKRVIYADGRDEGYDLRADPHEQAPFAGETLGFGSGWGEAP
ncbi:MAG: sulfatase [Alphaproteobacteria bacterium]|nr:sulfatase [Alphaproteobacteria bacterium]